MLEQLHRQARISTPLGENVLFLRRCDVSERLSGLTEIDFEVISESGDIDPLSLLGRNITIGLNKPSGGVRHFNGYVTRFGFAGRHGRNSLFRGVAQPWLWFLTRSANCRIFHNKSAVDIIRDVLRPYGSDYEFKLSAQPKPYEYCVQYNETDFNFVSRLMEKEGLYYHFTHDNGSHKLIVSNDNSQHSPAPGYETFELLPTDVAARTRREGLRSWRATMEVRPNKVRLQAYDFTKPRADISRDSTISKGYASGDFEVYEYPGEYVDPAVGGTYAKLRVEALQSGGDAAVAEGNYRGLATGCSFTLGGEEAGKFAGEYLVTSATHHIACDSFESGGDAEAETYFNTFEAMPKAEPFRPPRTTRRPRIQGPQTAMVVGQGEVDADEYGSVLVRFPWARNGEDSCRVRVSQAWAGAGWGGMAIPRIGHEVIVEFLEGDPDCPIITGRVYNAKAMPGYDPKEKGAVTTIKSSSTPGGGGSSEFTIDDSAGAERMFIDAEKDFDLVVGNNMSTTVGAARTINVGAAETHTVGAERHLSVGGDSLHSSGTTIHLNAGMDLLAAAGMNIVENASMNIHLKAGINIVLEGGANITLKAGGSFVTLGPGGVFISGPMVMINSGGAPMAGPGTKAKKANEASKVDAGEAGSIGELVADAKAAVMDLATSVATLSAALIQAAADGMGVAAQPAAGAGRGGGGGGGGSAGSNGYAPPGGGGGGGGGGLGALLMG